jgi:hypothetical protein
MHKLTGLLCETLNEFNGASPKKKGPWISLMGPFDLV